MGTTQEWYVVFRKSPAKTPHKTQGKKLDWNYTRMVRCISKKTLPETPHKTQGKKLDWNYTRMVRCISKKILLETPHKTKGEKARWKLSKNGTLYFEKVLQEIPHKTVAVRPLTSHLKDHISKTKRTSSIRRAPHFIVSCGSSPSQTRQKHLEMPNCVSRHQNMSKLLTFPSTHSHTHTYIYIYNLLNPSAQAR